jgi:hypothetical protein
LINAIFPRDDYKWIVDGGTYRVLTADEAPKYPRINLKEPEKSPLLLKPTLGLPHGGGLRFAPGSRDYQTILNWVQRGAPYSEEAQARSSIEKIEVYPKEVVLDPGGRQQLLVTAYLSAGRQQDMTDSVLYSSSDPEVISVSDTGVVRANKRGESTVLIRAAGHATMSATVGVVGKPVKSYPKLEVRNYIDRYVFTKLRKFNIVPSPLSTDAEFLRRVCLDVAGTLPPPELVRQFTADKDFRKRDRLIEHLLNSPEYIDYWTFRFEDLMRVTFETSGRVNYISKARENWVRYSIATNKPYDQMARERIAAQGYSAAAGPADPQGMPELVNVFMGRRIECAQCHNHPYEAWSQDQFWGLAAFFVDRTGDQIGEVMNPRTKATVLPAFLDGTKLPLDQWTDPRMRLAEWMTSHPYFAEAAVNRMWSYFFARAVVEPVDDFRSTNPPTNPELLQALAKDFRDSGYDLKHLIETIVESRTYQLSSVVNETNKDDTVDYSHAQPRALEAAVLLDAISNVTQVPEKFQIDSFAAGGDEPSGSRAVGMNPDICPSQFMDAFGRSMRRTTPTGRPEVNLLAAMHMLAGSTYTAKITADGGRLTQLIKHGASNEKILEEFYLAALTRLPTSEEKTDLLAFLAKGSLPRQEKLARLVWAVISSREFAYNH